MWWRRRCSPWCTAQVFLLPRAGPVQVHMVGPDCQGEDSGATTFSLSLSAVMPANCLPNCLPNLQLLTVSLTLFSL